MSLIFDNTYRLFDFYMMITTKFDKLSLIDKFTFQIWLNREKYINLKYINYTQNDIKQVMSKVKRYVDKKLNILYFSSEYNH